jgi:hypothetical protein
LMQMTFLNNIRKIGRLVLSRTSCYLPHTWLVRYIITGHPTWCLSVLWDRILTFFFPLYGKMLYVTSVASLQTKVVTSRSNSTQSFDEVLQELEANRKASNGSVATPATTPTIPEDRPLS